MSPCTGSRLKSNCIYIYIYTYIYISVCVCVCVHISYFHLAAACGDYKWGVACSESCNCKDACDDLTGYCPTECNLGWSGDNCQTGKYSLTTLIKVSISLGTGLELDWQQNIVCNYEDLQMISLIAKFMGPTWGPSGTDRTQVGPMLAPLTWPSGMRHISWYQTFPCYYFVITTSRAICMVSGYYLYLLISNKYDFILSAFI